MLISDGPGQADGSGSAPAPATRGRPPVTVVVPTRDRPGLLARCLNSVRAGLGGADELIVVDSASRAPAAVADVVAPPGRLLRVDRPGVGVARNVGWRAARHQFVLFTDDDVVVDAGWVDELARSLSAHPDTGFVTGRIEAPTEQRLPRRQVALKRERDPAVFSAESVGNLGHSASLAVRQSALAAVRGFDEALGAGSRFRAAPEADLFDRLLTAGWLGRYEPAALAWHDQWRTNDQLWLLDYGYGVGNGARLAKLVRTRPRRARLVARDVAWDWGLGCAGQEWRAGDRRNAALALVRVVGVMVGFVRGMTTRLDDDHFHRPAGVR